MPVRTLGPEVGGGFGDGPTLVGEENKTPFIRCGNLPLANGEARKGKPKEDNISYGSRSLQKMEEYSQNS